MRYIEDVDGSVSADIAPAEQFTVPLAVASQEQPSFHDAAAVLAATASQPFNLSEGPLLRAHLLCMGPQGSMLALVMHHAVGDAWSLVSAAAAAHARGQTVTPLALPCIAVPDWVSL